MKRFVLAAVCLSVVAVLLWFRGPGGQRETGTGPRVVSPAPEVDPPPATVAPAAAVDREGVEPAVETGRVEATFPVRVETVRPGDERTPVPDLDFEVRTKEGEALLAEGTTDPRGVALLELPASLLPTEGRVRLQGRITARGFQGRPSWLNVPAEPPGEDAPLVFSILALAGGTARGTLYDTRGEVAAGSVRAMEQGGTYSKIRGRVGDDGKVALHFEESGTYRLRAEVGGTHGGTLVTEPLEIDVLDPPQDLELWVVGPGVVRGQVLDAAGVPTAGLSVLALAHEADVGKGTFVVPDAISLRLTSAGSGFYWRTGETDANGEFELTALQENVYVVRARTDGRSGYPHLLTPQPVPADGEPLTLRLDRPHLLVRVRDVEGEPVLAEVVHDRGWRPRFLTDWPSEARVSVTPAPSSAKSAAPYGLLQKGKSVAMGELVYDLPLGADYLVTLLSPGQLPETRRVEMRADAGRVVCDFVVRATRASGTVEVDVLDPEGRPLLDDVSVRLVDPASGLTLLDRRDFYRPEQGKDWPVRFEVPAGDYRLEVESLPFEDGHHGTLMTSREFGGFATEVAVNVGVATAVTAQLSEGARLGVKLVGENDEEDLAAVLSERPRLADNEEEALGVARQATLLLWPRRGYPREVERKVPWMLGGEMLSSEWNLGEEDVSERLSPGSYTLEARLRGGRTLRREVVLEPGRTLAVEFDFSDAGER